MQILLNSPGGSTAAELILDLEPPAFDPADVVEAMFGLEQNEHAALEDGWLFYLPPLPTVADTIECDRPAPISGIIAHASPVSNEAPPTIPIFIVADNVECDRSAPTSGIIAHAAPTSRIVLPASFPLELQRQRPNSREHC